MRSALYGLSAEFKSPEELLAAAEAAYLAGYRQLDAHSPFPIDGLAEALGAQDHRVAPLVFAGGVLGAVSGYFMQWYALVVSYPVHVGGRPGHSWQAFIPVTFELTVLGAALAGVLVGVLALCRLPRLHHPVFSAPRFERASQDAYFLVIEASDPLFTREKTSEFLNMLSARQVSEVAA
jgi:hypothetical protein